MGCCIAREKPEKVTAQQKWDYINLSDFKSTSCLTPLSYGVLYVSLIISVACYGVDLFTAVNLLVFDRWSGQVQPVIPFTISRWIFAGCIILSWIFLAYRWLRAIRAMRGGGVAQSYMDPLAVRIQSIRMGAQGRGWRRFLVFAELTKSKKGTEYLALFTYFSFEAWMRIIFAEGPRNAINAMTLYSVMQLNLLPNGKHAAVAGHTPVVQFFYNIQILANSNQEQVVILFGMLFTLIIWVISALGLAAACLTYILFLWHHIPASDGGLSGYCKRKIDSRLQKIVGIKVKKALAKGDFQISTDVGKPGERPVRMKRQPTIPILAAEGDDKLSEGPMLSRQTTQASLPPYTSRPPTRNDDPLPTLSRQPTIPDMSVDSSRPGLPSRSVTQSSALSSASYASDAPLMGEAASMGSGPPGRSYCHLPPSRMDTDGNLTNERPLMNRSTTGASQGSQRSFVSSRRPVPSAQGERYPGPLSRQNTGMSNNAWHGRSTPGPPSISPLDTYGQQTPFQAYEMHSQRPSRNMQRSASGNRYLAYNPNMNTSLVEASPDPALTPSQPYRNFTAPGGQPRSDYFPQKPRPPQRSGTAPLPQAVTYDDSSFDSYSGNAETSREKPFVLHRAATTSPSAGTWAGDAPGSMHQYKPGGY